VKQWSTRGSIVLLVLLMTVVVVGQATTTTSSGCYEVGELIQFKVQDTTRGWWWGGCCCECTCDETQVTGWHIANSSGETTFEVLHDDENGPVAASIWQANWAQIDSSGVTVPPGEYTLYVDTSVGTLSHSLQVYDPCSYCGYCNFFWHCNWCDKTSTIITNCSCKTSLVLLKEESNCCWPLFRFQCGSSCP